MTELPKANVDPSNGGPGDDGTTTCSNDEDVKNTSACKRNHEEESVVTAKCAAGDATATDGKKGRSSVSIQNTGGSNKRGKREWLAFRGSRQSRVGDDYQVASLPPVGSNTKPNKSEKD